MEAQFLSSATGYRCTLRTRSDRHGRRNKTAEPRTSAQHNSRHRGLRRSRSLPHVHFIRFCFFPDALVFRCSNFPAHELCFFGSPTTTACEHVNCLPPSHMSCKTELQPVCNLYQSGETTLTYRYPLGRQIPQGARGSIPSRELNAVDGLWHLGAKQTSPDSYSLLLARGSYNGKWKEWRANRCSS